MNTSNRSSILVNTCSDSFPRCAVAGPNAGSLNCCFEPAGCCSSTSGLLDCCKPPPVEDSQSSNNTSVWIILTVCAVVLMIFVPIYLRSRLRKPRTDFAYIIESHDTAGPSRPTTTANSNYGRTPESQQTRL
ncbi:hypothetical protein Ae201684P_010389 [Aphanomyces euteiches]|uniref:Uncharacterized protein n=1 Tax=Aphanomyces euteiches TaxID=100861 RepID=A0A6G0WPJ6_9STRA|nr:hypothetical protein Ae201684_013074 [Aphanomyces euteiches]KAH9076445.1 hypothetical protein Ae201684P_010389 [Aphanomyces euteiches]